MKKGFERIEKDGEVAYVEGKRSLRVPEHGSLREGLVRLLESVDGNVQHPEVLRFWRDKAADIGVPDDEMKAAWAAEVFEKLSDAWDELITPQAEETEVDVFGEFGI